MQRHRGGRVGHRTSSDSKTYVLCFCFSLFPPQLQEEVGKIRCGSVELSHQEIAINQPEANLGILYSAFQLPYSRIPSSSKIFPCYFHPFIPPTSLTLGFLFLFLFFLSCLLHHCHYHWDTHGEVRRKEEKKYAREESLLNCPWNWTPSLPLCLTFVIILTSLPPDSSQILPILISIK